MDQTELQGKARETRELVLKSLYEAGSGHAGGALGLAEILVVLFFGGVMAYDASDPEWEGRDRLILSNGHTCPGLYVVMALAGYLPVEELKSLRKLGSRLQGHPQREALPGLETTSGPLGSGLAQGVGMALGLSMDEKPNKVFVICSDGEHDEGNHWEAVMLAAKYKLGNLVGVTDRNGIQISGHTKEVMPLEPLAEKYEAFGWLVVEVDGHHIEQVQEAIRFGKENYEKPMMIIAHTTLGKGVSFMENNPEWHGKGPDEEELKAALDELSNGSD